MSALIRAAAVLLILALGACAAPEPAGDAVPPGPDGMEGAY